MEDADAFSHGTIPNVSSTHKMIKDKKEGREKKKYTMEGLSRRIGIARVYDHAREDDVLCSTLMFVSHFSLCAVFHNLPLHVHDFQ